jgi:predicted dehydrogenase
VTHRILVVGCGSHGQRHLRCFLRTGRVEAATCDQDPRLVERASATHGVVGFNDWQTALIVHAPEAVVIAASAAQHVPIAAFALRHGAGVLIEKPLSTTLDDLPAMNQALAGSRAAAAVAYVGRFLPGLAQMREFLQSGDFGAPLQVAASAGQHLPTMRPDYRETRDAFHESGGGAIHSELTDLVDAVQWLVGPATRLYCETARQSLTSVEVEDTVCVTARHGDLLAGYSLNQFQAPNELTIQVHCQQGSLRFESHRQRWSKFPLGGEAWEHHMAPIAQDDDPFVALAHAFLDCLEKKDTPICTIAEAERALRFNLAAHRSARESIMVTIDDDPCP